jgi:hypothetical protein
MKTTSTKVILVLTGIFLVTSFFAGCSKDKEDENSITEVFTVTNAVLKSGSLPSGSSSGPSISHFSGNNIVIPGGSNAIVVESEQDASSVLIGVEGMTGYYELNIPEKSTSITIYLLINPAITQTEFEILLALRQGNQTGIHQRLAVGLHTAGTGKLQVSLSWDKDVDLDLYLVDPAGETIFYGNTESENGGELDVDSNAGCSIDGINNENITYGDDSVLLTGEYIVRVNLYMNCGVGEQINYIATARVNGNIINPSWGTNPKVGFYPAGSTSQFGWEDAGIEIMKFTVNSTNLENAANYFYFSFPETKARNNAGK